jgi:hypothetical protein
MGQTREVLCWEWELGRYLLAERFYQGATFSIVNYDPLSAGRVMSRARYFTAVRRRLSISLCVIISIGMTLGRIPPPI